MQQYTFQLEDWSVPVQWSQVVDHNGHPDRAAARMCGHLGNLASALSAHGGAGGKSIIIFFQLTLENRIAGENQSSYSLKSQN